MAVLFTGDFETGDFSQWVVQNVFHNDPGAEYTDTYAAAIVTGSPQGSYGARFELRDGDVPFGSSERTEVQGPSYTSGGEEGDDRWYEWWTKFDPLFPSNHASQGWGLVAQFHDQSGGSPPLGLYVDDANGQWCLRVNEQSSPGVFVASHVLWSAPLDNGVWQKVKLHIKWSTNSTVGFVELWHDGVAQPLTGGATKVFIQTLTPGGGGTYFKQGYYRNGAVTGTGVVFHDGFVAATTDQSPVVSRRNVAVNPAAKNNLTDWYQTGGVAATTRVTGLAGMDRSTGARVTGTGAPGGDYLLTISSAGQTAGAVYTVSPQVRVAGGVDDVEIYILFLDAALAVLASSNVVINTSDGVPARTWVTATAPANTAHVAVEAEIDSSTNVLTMTAVLIEQTSEHRAFLDGDSPACSWDGVAGNSTSTQSAGAIVISPTPIPPAESAPAPTVTLGITIRPQPIPSAERVPRPTVSGGAPPIDLEPTRTRWQLVAGPASGGHELALTFARERKLTFRLGEPSEASFVIDGRHHQASALAELATDVHVIYQPPTGPARILYRGRVGATRDSLDADSHAMSVATLDYRAVLERRILWSDSQLTWTATDQAAIARGLLAQTQTRPGGNLGISPGTNLTGVTRDRTYEAGDSIGERIQELSEVLDGFEWDVEPASASGLTLQIFHPQRGLNRGVILEYGGLVSTVDRGVDPAGYANAIRVTGRQNDAGIAPTPVELAASDIATVPQGRWDKAVGEDIETQAALQDRAGWQLDQAQIIHPSYTLGLRPGGWRGPDHIWVGDTVRTVIYSGRLLVDANLRVFEISFDIPDTGDEQVSVTVGAPKPDIRRRGARVDRRLANLERR